MPFRVITISFIFLATALAASANSENHSYNPARWSPLSQYLMGTNPGGPAKILAYDSSGKIEQTANLSYSKEGRLLQESYFDQNGNAAGSTVYEYKNGLPVHELLYGPKKELRSRIVRTYSGDQVSTISTFSAEDKLITRQYFDYNQKGISGSEKTGDQVDSFFIHYLNGRPHRIDFQDSANGVFQEVQYVYGSNGKLIQRVRTNSVSKSRCDHEYDNKGRLSSLTYYDNENNSWILIRKLVLKYK